MSQRNIEKEFICQSSTMVKTASVGQVKTTIDVWKVEDHIEITLNTNLIKADPPTVTVEHRYGLSGYDKIINSVDGKHVDGNVLSTLEHTQTRWDNQKGSIFRTELILNPTSPHTQTASIYSARFLGHDAQDANLQYDIVETCSSSPITTN
jgi:hypothetical protein